MLAIRFATAIDAHYVHVPIYFPIYARLARPSRSALQSKKKIRMEAEDATLLHRDRDPQGDFIFDALCDGSDSIPDDRLRPRSRA
jgi:hypothetical protein